MVQPSGFAPSTQAAAKLILGKSKVIVNASRVLLIMLLPYTFCVKTTLKGNQQNYEGNPDWISLVIIRNQLPDEERLSLRSRYRQSSEEPQAPPLPLPPRFSRFDR